MSKKIFTLIAFAATVSAHAQNDTATQTLDNVIVTANKFAQKQSTTGKVITVITKDQIEKSSGKTVAQILNEQAGVTIAGAYNNAGSVQTVFMRGASSGRTLILLDGIPMNDPSMINNEFDLNLFSLSQVEQIEICRGAQSTLYGSDAIAGVINIITVNPNVKKPLNIKTTHSIGSFGTYKGNIQVYGKANKLSYSARYAKLKTDGFSAAFGRANNPFYDKDAYD
jgi:vitamin B12 transporter